MRHAFLLLAASVLTAIPMYAQDYEDDIYYDGRKAEKQQAQRAVQQQTTYSTPSYSYEETSYTWYPTIEQERDVDEYNRFGSYYESAIDTIGYRMADSEDFIYTQQIQKYYNPTIVADNQSVLADVLDNSYGNVNVVYGVTGPAFASWAYVPYYTAYTPWGGFYSPTNWGWYTGWLDPWYGISFGWGGFGIGLNWGWGWTTPGWGWGWNSPGWHHPHYPGFGGWHGSAGGYHPRPSVGVRPGWSNGVRPGYNHAGVSRPGMRPSGSRPGMGVRPGSNTRPGVGTRPGWSAGTRPGTSTRPSNNSRPGMNTRPAQTNRPAQSTRPSQGTRPGGNMSRPGGNGGGWSAPSRGGASGGGGRIGRGSRFAGSTVSPSTVNNVRNSGYINGAGSTNRGMGAGVVGNTTSRPSTSNSGGHSTAGYRPGSSTSTTPAVRNSSGSKNSGSSVSRSSSPRTSSSSRSSSGSFRSSGSSSSRSSGSFRSSGGGSRGGGGGRASGGRR